jgi:L-iditol 2-dehydrogenase
MRSALLYGEKDIRTVDVAVPVAGEGELLVKVEACGICPGDVRAWSRGTHPAKKLPANLGHEATGIVVEAGSDDGRRHLGRRVFADGLGGYAEFKVIERWSLERSDGPTFLPDALGFEAGVFVEPLADCLHAVEQCAQIHEATSAVVIGCGQMGLQLVRLCVLAGARVLACDPLPHRRSLACTFGAELAVESCSDGEFADAVFAMTAGRGADCVFLTCADPSVTGPALACLGDAGRCVFFSGYENDFSSPVDLELVHRKRLQLIGSRWIGSSRKPLFHLYDRAAQLLAQRLIDVDSLIQTTVGLDQLNDAFRAVKDRAVLKAIVTVNAP